VNNHETHKEFFYRGPYQGEEPLDTGGCRVFSLDASFGLLVTANASALALFLDSALCCCGVLYDRRDIAKHKKGPQNGSCGS